jgi:hypothetical protein
MSMDIQPDPHTPIPGGAHDAEPALVALAQAIGVHLRKLPEEELIAQHVTRAADTARTSGSSDTDAATDAATSASDRAPALIARTGEHLGARRPRGPRSHSRSWSRAVTTVQRSVLALAVVVAGGAGIMSWLNRSADTLPLIALAAPSSAAMGASDDATSRESTLAGDQPAVGLIWVPIDYTFILEDGARVAAGSGPAWRFVPPSDPVAIAARLSARFALPALAPSEWDAATLEVSTDAGSLTLIPTGEWYFGAPYDASMEWRCPEVDPSTSTQSDQDATTLPAFECEPPPPARGVPSAEEARGLTRELFEGLGISGVRIMDVSVDDWTAHVWGLIGVEGAPSDVGLYVSVGFGADRRIQYANGTFARPVSLGAYPTVSSEVALERLREQMDPDNGMVQPSPRSGPTEAGPGEQERPQVTVRLVAAELVVQYVWTADEQMILAPHYRFRDIDGGEWWVIAVEDRYLAR